MELSSVKDPVNTYTSSIKDNDIPFIGNAQFAVLNVVSSFHYIFRSGCMACEGQVVDGIQTLESLDTPCESYQHCNAQFMEGVEFVGESFDQQCESYVQNRSRRQRHKLYKEYKMKRTHDNIRDSLQKNHDEYSPRGMFSNDGIHLARARNWNPSAASSLLDKNMMRKHDEYSPKGIFSNDGIHLAQNRNPSASSLLDINMMRKNDIRDGLHKNHDEYSSKGIFSNDGIHLAQNRNPNASSLPDKNMIHSGGIILSKSPSMSIIQQKWQQMVWVRYNRTQLLFFSSMDDCESWIGKVSITEEQRLNLVAMKINFFREYSESDVELFYATKIKLEQLGPYNL